MVYVLDVLRREYILGGICEELDDHPCDIVISQPSVFPLFFDHLLEGVVVVFILNFSHLLDGFCLGGFCGTSEEPAGESVGHQPEFIPFLTFCFGGLESGRGWTQGVIRFLFVDFPAIE